MALKEYRPGAAFPGVIGRTFDKSSPAWPEPLRCWTSTYAAGAQGVRMPLTTVFLPLLITVVILLIADLTNERTGIISVSQQPLVDLQNAIR